MDIAVTILVAVAIAGAAFMAGAFFADRRDRKQALTDLREGELRMRQAHAAQEEAVKGLVSKINETHNKLVTQVGDTAGRVESLMQSASMKASRDAKPGPLGKNPYG